MLHLIDWVADPNAAGAGTALLRHIQSMTRAALFAVGGSADTVRILPHIGFRPLGAVTSYARPLFPGRFRRHAARALVVHAARVARALAWAATAPSHHVPGWTSEPAAEATEAAALLPAGTAGSLARMGRSVALLRHTLECPILPVTLHIVRRAAELRGYFLLATAPGQVRIIDCWIEGESADWRALVMCAVGAARREDQAAEVVMWASDPYIQSVLESCGFHARGVTQTLILVPDGNPCPPALRIQMLDNDAAFLHEGVGYLT